MRLHVGKLAADGRDVPQSFTGKVYREGLPGRVSGTIDE